MVNNLRVKQKVLRNQDAIVFGKDHENVYVFFEGESSGPTVPELDKKIQVLDLNLEGRMANPLQHQFKQRLDPSVLEQQMTADQKNF